MLVFFFSSRRRHTRYWRDWSSDVCSSDLTGTYLIGMIKVSQEERRVEICRGDRLRDQGIPDISVLQIAHCRLASRLCVVAIELRDETCICQDVHIVRSEEHTSELQSRQYLVCRLLLEKNTLPLVLS